MPDTIGIAINADGVATVEVRRPPANFMDVESIGRIADAFDELDNDPGCRAIVLCSKGKHFCAGAMLRPETDVGTDSAGRHVYDEAIRIFRCSTPIVAAVQGAAIGGGLGLALAADFRVATVASRLSANFAKLGFHHGFGLTVTLPDVVGMQQARHMLLRAARLNGSQAHSIGLVDVLADETALRSEAVRLASSIASNGPLSVRSIRMTLRGDFVERVEAAMIRERAEQERLQRTADFSEGVIAMGQRRPPIFTGR